VKPLDRAALAQSNEDAREIVQILDTFADYRISRHLRERLAAVKERAKRIVRNTEIAP
jgi:hypothetical protein